MLQILVLKIIMVLLSILFDRTLFRTLLLPKKKGSSSFDNKIEIGKCHVIRKQHHTRALEACIS